MIRVLVRATSNVVAFFCVLIAFGFVGSFELGTIAAGGLVKSLGILAVIFVAARLVNIVLED